MGRKRPLIGVVVAFVALLGVASAAPQAVFACSCEALIGMDTTDPNAEIIFAGTAVNVADPRFPFDPIVSSGDLMEWTFVVDSVEKGWAADRIVVLTERHEASCEFPFELGRRYRVVASDLGRGLHAGLCQGTGEVRPLADRPEVEGRAPDTPANLLWLAFLVPGLVTALIVVERSRARSGQS